MGALKIHELPEQERPREKLAAQGAPDPKALADLRDRYDTDQLSTLTTRA